MALRLQAGGQIGGRRLGPPLAVLFEGWDAAGKGGAIRRLTGRLDPRHFTVAQFAAPTERERRHHFLWRFAPWLPGWGGMTVFDRTWYGRVLVERVEGFASEAEWERAYGQIVEFERGQADPLKRWKLTDEDWRNRERRADYEQAIEEMLRRTDHSGSPWHVVAAESKPLARVTVLETVIAALEGGLGAAGEEPVTAEMDL
jgi:polyphosphate kinase 2 (PPK2 family)